MRSHSDRQSEAVHVGNQFLEISLRLAVLRLRFLYIFMVIDHPKLVRRGESNVPHISSPIDHVPVHIAWIDDPDVQHRRLLSVIYVDRESNRWPNTTTKSQRTFPVCP